MNILCFHIYTWYFVTNLLLEFCYMTCLTIQHSVGNCDYFNLPHCHSSEATNSRAYTCMFRAHPAFWTKATQQGISCFSSTARTDFLIIPLLKTQHNYVQLPCWILKICVAARACFSVSRYTAAFVSYLRPWDECWRFTWYITRPFLNDGRYPMSYYA